MKTTRDGLWVPVLAFFGLAAGLVGMSWIVGTLGVSAVTAQAIVRAVEVGSWGMFLASIAATGGLVGATLWGVIRITIARVGSRAAVA